MRGSGVEDIGVAGHDFISSSIAGSGVAAYRSRLRGGGDDGHEKLVVLVAVGESDVENNCLEVSDVVSESVEEDAFASHSSGSGMVEYRSRLRGGGDDGNEKLVVLVAVGESDIENNCLEVSDVVAESVEEDAFTSPSSGSGMVEYRSGLRGGGDDGNEKLVVLVAVGESDVENNCLVSDVVAGSEEEDAFASPSSGSGMVEYRSRLWGGGDDEHEKLVAVGMSDVANFKCLDVLDVVEGSGEEDAFAPPSAGSGMVEYRSLLWGGGDDEHEKLVAPGVSDAVKNWLEVPDDPRYSCERCRCVDIVCRKVVAGSVDEDESGSSMINSSLRGEFEGGGGKGIQHDCGLYRNPMF